ncbi:MAG: DUF1573 domain-containing protein [Ferruginibacter sp.]
MKKMIIRAFVAVAACTLMSFTWKPAPLVFSVSPGTSNVTWVNETYDFGEISQGKPVSVEFEFTNSGNEAILVSDVVTSCGCTAPDYPKEPIAPGKSSKIKVTYNAASLGVFSKTIAVNFQDPGLKKVLNIKGTVK